MAATTSRPLTAATKNLGDRVEIRIRDNGTGIPPEVKEKMFNPFFTTKPAGEGTGLGLSISHDIVVKQHGGSIEVDTQPGRVHRNQDHSAACGCCSLTNLGAGRMSAIGTKRTSHFALHMSAIGGKADMAFCTANVRF